MPKKPDYDGTADAERILERTLKRTRWGVDVRDALARQFERVVQKQFEAAFSK